MPLVLLKRDKEKYSDKNPRLRALVSLLPEMIAEALTVEGTPGELSASDVEVYVSNFGPLDIYNKPIEIVILANEFPERLANLKERLDKITEKINPTFLKKLLPGGYSIWLNLIKGTYVEF